MYKLDKTETNETFWNVIIYFDLNTSSSWIKYWTKNTSWQLQNKDYL